MAAARFVLLTLVWSSVDPSPRCSPESFSPRTLEQQTGKTKQRITHWAPANQLRLATCSRSYEELSGLRERYRSLIGRIVQSRDIRNNVIGQGAHFCARRFTFHPPTRSRFCRNDCEMFARCRTHTFYRRPQRGRGFSQWWWMAIYYFWSHLT